MERILRKISLKNDEPQIARDLQKYQDKALELGATRVKIVRSELSAQYVEACRVEKFAREIQVGRLLRQRNSLKHHRPRQGDY